MIFGGNQIYLTHCNMVWDRYKRAYNSRNVMGYLLNVDVLSSDHVQN